MGIFRTGAGKKAVFLAATTALLVMGTASGAPRIPAGGYLSPADYPGYVLAWRDEFNGRQLDKAKWQAHDGPALAMGDGALQYDRPGNLTLEDGYLVFTARSEAYGGRDYVSASVSTRDRQSFTYGRVDVRARVPAGQGLWPSVRLLGLCQGRGFCGAIDVMEIAGGEREDEVYGTLRWPDKGGQQFEGGSISLPNQTFDEQFHVYSVIWDPDRVRWLVDDRLYLERHLEGPQFDVFRDPFYLFIGLAIGGEWAGPPDASTRFPARLAVDYVRVFQRE